jgi:hypothetical protein
VRIEDRTDRPLRIAFAVVMLLWLGVAGCLTLFGASLAGSTHMILRLAIGIFAAVMVFAFFWLFGSRLERTAALPAVLKRPMMMLSRAFAVIAALFLAVAPIVQLFRASSVKGLAQ